MIFTETSLSNAFVIDVEPTEDDRGYFARTWCRQEFEEHGLETRFAQANVAFNHQRGTLRGMHYQVAPSEETKLVRCPRGAIYDVIVDLRPNSPTYEEYVGFELTESNGRLLYVPPGFAHGYQTLVDNSEVAYQVSELYAPDCERGARFDDPAFGISWPLDVSIISDKDSNHPLRYARRQRG